MIEGLKVSILVLVDAALRRRQSMNTTPNDTGFNPCFSGCRPATRHSQPFVKLFNKVSILVLVDAALRQVGIK